MPSLKSGTVFILAMLATCLIFIPFSPEMPTMGLDPSWIYALNQVVEQNLIFGRDFIFTFGPLGYISTVQYSPGTDARMLLGSFIFIFGFISSAHLIIACHQRWWLLLLPILLPTFVVRDAIFIVFPFILLLAIARITTAPLSFFHLDLSPKKIFSLGISTYALGMMTLIKSSFIGAILPICGIIFILLWLHKKMWSIYFISLFIFSICTSWIISGQDLRNIAHYFLSIAPIVSGYSAAMSFPGSWGSVVSMLLGGSLTGYILHHTIYFQMKCRRAWWITISAIFIFFVAFKAGFVRQDGHVDITLGVLFVFACIASLYTKGLKLAGLWIFVSSTLVFVQESRIGTTSWIAQNNIFSRWSLNWNGLKERVSQPEKLSERYAHAREAIRKKHPLPATTETVDIYPTELSVLLAHDLKWSGRPIPQSYSVYTSSLDAINAAHLRSERAPEIIFFRFDPLDNRFPAIEDASSILELLSRYTASDWHPPYIVLKKEKSLPHAALVLRDKKTIQSVFGETIYMDTEHPVWMQVMLEPSLIGKFLTLLFRTPVINMEIMFKNGQTITKRILPEIASSGFIASPYLASVEDFVALASGINPHNPIISIRFLTQYLGLWKRAIKIQMTPIDITPQNLTLISNIYQLTAENLPIDDDKHALANCSLDRINGLQYNGKITTLANSETLHFYGWAAAKNISDAIPTTELWIIRNDNSGNVQEIRANMVERADVAAHFNQPILRNSGYKFSIPTPAAGITETIQLKLISENNTYLCPAAVKISIKNID